MKAMVLGSGGWGTALALLLCDNGHAVSLWSHNPEKAEAMRKTRENPLLSGVPLPEELRRHFHVPAGGEAIGIRCEEDFIGALQLLPDEELGIGWLGWYWLDPAYRGTGHAFAPMGRVLLYYRHRGVELLRLRCGDRELRRFFARLGFYPLEGDVMEKDIRVQLPPIPAEYRP